MSKKHTPVKRGPSNGSKVETLVERKPIVEYLYSSLGMYVYTVIFSIFGVIFIIDSIPSFVKILLGIVFATPAIIVETQKGKNAGEKAYKLKNKTVLSDIHEHKINNVNVFVSLLHVAPYVISAMLLVIIGVTAKIQFLQGLMSLIFLPVTLIFLGAGLIRFEQGFISWFNVLSVGINVLLVSSAFVIGYIYGVHSLRSRASEIVNEIRSFE